MANCLFRVLGYVPELGSPNMFHYISRKPLGFGGLHFESCCIAAYLFWFPLSYHGKGHILLSLWMGHQCALTPWQVGPEQQELLGISPNTYHPFINLGELPFWWMVGGSRSWFSRKDHIFFAQIILTKNWPSGIMASWEIFELNFRWSLKSCEINELSWVDIPASHVWWPVCLFYKYINIYQLY